MKKFLTFCLFSFLMSGLFFNLSAADKADKNSPKAAETTQTAIDIQTNVDEQFDSDLNDPFSVMDARINQIQQEMNQMFNSPFIKYNNMRPAGRFACYNSPSIRFNETDNEYTLKVITPGMDKKNLTLTVKDNILTVAGKQNQKTRAKKGDKVVSNEEITSSFSQSWTLPIDANAEKISSKYKDGVLTIIIPKDVNKAKQDVKTINID